MCIKKGEVFSNRITAANVRIAHAFEKEAEDVFGDLLIDTVLGLHNPVKAKISIENNC